MEDNFEEILNTRFDDYDELMDEDVVFDETGDKKNYEFSDEDEEDNKIEDLSVVNGQAEDDINAKQANHSKEILKTVSLKVVAEIAQVSLSINELLALKTGSVIDVGKINQFIHLRVNDNYFAQGILVDIDGRLGVKIINRLN